MGRIAMVVGLLGAAGTLVLGQAPPPATPPAAGTTLDAVLLGWEKSMTAIKSLEVECRRTVLDKTFQTTDVFQGRAKFLRSPAGQGSRASLELFKTTDKGLRPEIFEKYVCSGTYLYEYAPGSKVIRIHQLPPPRPGQVADDNFLSFLFGMKATEAKARYDLTLDAAPAGDKWYHYVRIRPKFAADKADFTQARLVLSIATMLPRQLWFHQPNGNEVTWDFPKVGHNVHIPVTEFAQPTLPTGWKWERVPAQTQPRVMRNNQ